MVLSIGVDADLAARSPTSFNRSRQYFLWQRLIPSLVLATSIPMKYFNLPRSSMLNFSLRICLTNWISCKSFPARTKSST
ncbi:hypothetical protein Lalb_Chr09g0331401 [Lupinus albus]|uniref:Uncharacterized protein n=1 Tax=Lupinus albus TaxID=3870 RepID=A0A6A4Q0G9_LUPAL|nr:hypothetical protein Lalb_Chr09g0331401 [Lupinus albus]